MPLPNRATAGFFSRITFSYTIPAFLNCLRGDIHNMGILECAEKYSSKVLLGTFEAAWNLEKTKKNPSLLNALIKTYWLEFLLIGILALLCDLILTATQIILLMKLLISFSVGDRVESFAYAVVITVNSILYVLIKHNYLMSLEIFGMKLRIALSDLIFKKSLRIDRDILNNKNVVDIVTLMSVDTIRCERGVFRIHIFWVCVTQIAVAYYTLGIYLGYSSTLGLLFIMSFLPLILLLSRISFVWEVKALAKSQERIRTTNTFLRSVEMVKMCTWEKPFYLLVTLLRNAETRKYQTVLFIKAILSAFVIFVPRTAQSISIIFVAVLNKELSSSYVFSIVAFYNLICRTSILYYSFAMEEIFHLQLSLKRIEEFLTYKDASFAPHNSKQFMKQNLIVSDFDNDYWNGKILLQNVSASWFNDKDKHTISNVTMELTKNDIYALVGSVGSGKTSLLSVIANNLPVTSGTVEVEGTVSYASQDQWILDGTVQTNILFGEEMDNDRYLKVINLCALETDLYHMVQGDQTVIGRRGKTLENAQKVRINLARAIYKQADIYLLDDIFSFVDTDIGKFIFEECVLKFLSNKCVLFVSHHAQFLKRAKILFLMDDGQIVKQGTYEELQASNFNYTQFFYAHKENFIRKDEHKRHTKIRLSISDAPSVRNILKLDPDYLNVYLNFFNTAGSLQLLQILILYTLTYMFAHGTDYYLMAWLNLSRTSRSRIMPEEEIVNVNIRNYIILVLLTIIFSLIASISFFNYWMRASKKFYRNMFNNVIYAPIEFFRSNGIENILNAFSYDLRLIDFDLPVLGANIIQNFFQLIAVVFVVCFAVPWIVIITGVILFIFYLLFSAYLTTRRRLLRTETNSRESLISYFASYLIGITTVPVQGSRRVLENELHLYQDAHTAIWFMHVSLKRAFGFWLDITSMVYIDSVMFAFLLLGDNEVELGFVFNQILLLIGILEIGFKDLGIFENVMSSLKKIVTYSSIKPEKDILGVVTSTNWPYEGIIEFHLVSVRSRSVQHPGLRKASFKTLQNEKIGIYGKSSAGKSSVIHAICQFVETTGLILIDKINIAKISLYNLRSNICVVPQTHLLFFGSLRTNLDPFEEYSDDALWNALEEVQLKPFVMSLPLSLEHVLYEEGVNLSVGQRQLLCLARAILAKKKILIIDESIENLDPYTHCLIQKTIRNTFSNCTVLQISHKFQNVIGCDRIMIIDRGKIVEFDQPYELLNDKYSSFSFMLNELDEMEMKKLSEIAKMNYKKRKS